MVIYWHKRDYRLNDNQALKTALDICAAQKLEFLPIMGLETDLIENSLTSYEFGKFQQFGAISAIIPLSQNYNYYGITSAIFVEPILSFLGEITKSKTIKYIISHQEHGTNGTFQRDKEVKLYCQKKNIIWTQVQPSGVIRNLKNRDTRDAIVKKYLNKPWIPVPKFPVELQSDQDSSFWKNIKRSNLSSIKQFEDILDKVNLTHHLQPTSEKSSLNTLHDFVTNRAKGYRGGISSPNKAITSGSRLSQFLAFGSLSPRFAYQNYWSYIKLTTDDKIKSGILGSMQRLFWREHFVQRIETSPNMPDVAINQDFDKVTYSHNSELFEAFKTGKTGEPLIDSCMRCLNKTGFINFRMRAMIISYAVFGLDLNWRQVGRYLASVFLDYEPGIHWSQIQMQSGVTGINTIRVYSPSKQLIDQDPECLFVKMWIPELAKLDNQKIVNYQKIDLNDLTDGLYPKPIVNFQAQSKLNKAKVYGLRTKENKENAKATFIKHGSRKKSVKVKTEQNKKLSRATTIPVTKPEFQTAN